MTSNDAQQERAIAAFAEAVADHDPEEADRQARIAWVFAEIAALIAERQGREANR
jgi:hypothetical protein